MPELATLLFHFCNVDATCSRLDRRRGSTPSLVPSHAGSRALEQFVHVTMPIVVTMPVVLRATVPGEGAW